MITKILIVTGKLQHYRIPIFNLIADGKDMELTVAHSGKKIQEGGCLFKEVLLEEKEMGPFTIHKAGFFNFCNEFDVVVATFYVQKLSFMGLLFGERKFKLIYWGIGVRASQNSRFDGPTFLNYFRYIIANRADAMIFYTDYAVKKYVSKGIDGGKLFVMQNTVPVEYSYIDLNLERNIVLFFGTLNKSKKVIELLECYKIAHQKQSDIVNLEIVGGGPDYNRVRDWIEENQLSEKIIAHGPIHDERSKARLFNRALCCISPNQAGLSVLTSFGYAVPFATYYDSITGGERLNIINDYNGILFDDFSEMTDIILDISSNPDKYKAMGINARRYYEESRSPEVMVDGFFDAVKYVLNNSL
jgi:glycosyltransferase involved in cell wall biosynthesis